MDIKPLMTKVVDALIALVESSDGKNWVKPWVNLGLGKQFRSNGELYRGVNQLWLGLIAVSEGLEAPHIWAGYSTWSELGYQVRKGESAKYNPVYASPIARCSVHGKGNPSDSPCCGQQNRFMMMRVLRGVFHLSQVDPIEGQVQTLPAMPETPQRPDVTPHGVVAAWVEHGMVVRTVDSDRAYFAPGPDYINMPPIEAFTDEVGYHATLFHEATHWSGGPSRLNRELVGLFGTQAYAFEELIAEIGSALLASALGFEPAPDAGHGEYLANWLQVLKDDPTKLHEAAMASEKAVKLLLELGQVEAVAA